MRPPIVARGHHRDDPIVRPVPARTGPLRHAAHLLRGEPNAEPAASQDDAVSLAYQVFDRYLAEGSEHAAGRSAWYPHATPGGGGARDGGGLWPTVARLVEQLAALGTRVPDLTRLLAAVSELAQSSARSPAPEHGPPPFHPAQRPDYVESPETGATWNAGQSMFGRSRWTDLDLDDDTDLDVESDPSKVSPVPAPPTGRQGFPTKKQS